MKRFAVIISIVGIAVVGTLALMSVARAQDAAPMTEAHIERIRANCIEAQTSLTQLHASDALLRVNRGQIYESISTKLMAPLNSRIALNKLDSNLLSITSQYERELTAFRLNYQQYEEAMSRTLKINCINQPVAFYDSVNDTRGKRSKVHDSTLALQKTIGTYKTEFEVFVTKAIGNKQ